MNLRAVLQQVPDSRGKQGRGYRLWSILSLIVVSLLCGRRGLRTAFFLGRSLNKRQHSALGFAHGKTPCHATLTETLRAIDGRALAEGLGLVCLVEGADQGHIAIDGKTMRASKDGDSNGAPRLRRKRLQDASSERSRLCCLWRSRRGEGKDGFAGRPGIF